MNVGVALLLFLFSLPHPRFSEVGCNCSITLLHRKTVVLERGDRTQKAYGL